MKNSRPTCGVENCNRQLVVPVGPVNAPFMLVGEFPGKDEIIQGIPFVGRTGEILRTELARHGLDINNFRLTNLWMHKPNPKKQIEWFCDMNWHATQLAKELKGRDVVLLMGSELTKLLFGKGIMETSGLTMKSDKFPKVRFVASPNPAQLLHGSMGEWRLALSRFAKLVR